MTTAEEKKVIYPFLGKSGLLVSNLCLGTMTFGQSKESIQVGREQCSEEQSHQIIQRYVEMGGNFLDTADIYSNGLSEQIIGTWLEKQPRENFVIATKVMSPMGSKDNINNRGLSRRHITEGITQSLERLRTDFVDLYQPHLFDDGTPLEETLRTLDDLVRCGKVRYTGVCNFTGWQMQKLMDTSNKLGIQPVVSLQQQYNLVSRHSEFESFQVCKNEGVGVLPWSPLKGGLFSGKIKQGVKPSEGRLGWAAQDETTRSSQAAPAWSSFDDQTYRILDVVEAIAKKRGRSVPQVALRWLLQKDVVSSVIIGVKTLAQLEDNMAAGTGWSLSKEEMEELDAVSAPPLRYPYEMVFRLNKSRRNPWVQDQYVKSVNEVDSSSSKTFQF